MSKPKLLILLLLALFLFTGSSMAAGTISAKISGPGAVNDTTVKAGEKFSIDIYLTNDTPAPGYVVWLQIDLGSNKECYPCR